MNQDLLSPPAPSSTAEQQVIAKKTAYWQDERWAVRHLNNSGERPRPLFQPIFNRLLSFIPEQSRVLDVGCGHGRLSFPLAEAGHTVVASDVSAEMLKLLHAHKGALPIEVRQADAHCLPATDGEFDAVVSYDFMPHFPDWRTLLREQARVCRVGGRVIFGFNFSEHRTFAEPFGGKDRYSTYHSPDVNSPKPFWAECTLGEVSDAAATAGLTVVEVVPVKFMGESFAFGQAIGTDKYAKLQEELNRRIEADPAVADFYTWLEMEMFQRLPFFTAYRSLVVLERVAESNDFSGDKAVSSPQAPRKTTPVNELSAFLGEVPSETTIAERVLLHKIFRDHWDGESPVVEIGPFLGGTTRAIAAGMVQNPRLQPDARLHTFDRFGDYYQPHRLRGMIDPLVRSGKFSPHEADALCASGDFLALFNAIHGDYDYFQLIRSHTAPMPDLPAEVAASGALNVLAAEAKFGAVFIDGCKSWAATHYAMRELLPRLQVGAPVIFQDFGWYTCFWISSFVHALQDVLELWCMADSTYAFRLRRAVTSEEIARCFALTPEGMGPKFFWKASTALFKESIQRRDMRGALTAQLHLVAALATLGDKKAAADVLRSIDEKPFGPLASMIVGSRRSPTYLPGGKEIRWD